MDGAIDGFDGYPLSLANLSSHRLPVPPVYAKARIVLILLRCAVRDTCNPSFFSLFSRLRGLPHTSSISSQLR